RSCRSLEDLVRATYVVVHRLDERVDAVETLHPADAFDERHLDLDVVELEVVAVEHVGLDAAFTFAVEGRVGPDADRRGEALSGVQAPQPPGVHPVGRGGRHRTGRHVGGREAQLPASPVATHDDAADHERPAERLRGTFDVPRGETRTDVGRRPDLWASV